ncbi:MAG: SDR family oxidoreductase [Actinobacteria bacterium]|nr:SDR family oxidoreductase [Actinomycetota bacterium]
MSPTRLLEAKTIIITGTGPGLGGELARTAFADGANVVIGARSAEALEALAADLDPSGERVVAVPTDITSAEDCERIVATAVARFGRVDGLAQIAAYTGSNGGLRHTDFAKVRRSIETNLIGSMQISLAAANAMSGSGGGSIVLVGSQSMLMPLIEQIGYASSKGALLSASYHMAKELGPDNIRVNTVVPSWMWGPPVEVYVQWQAQARGISEADAKAELEAGIPLGEVVPDEEVANAIAFFLSDRARCITGQSLLVNGGEMMR